MGVLELNAFSSLATQVSSMFHMLSNLNIQMGKQDGQPLNSSNVSQVEEVSCVYCNEGHTFDNCSFNPTSVCYLGNQNRG